MGKQRVTTTLKYDELAGAGPAYANSSDYNTKYDEVAGADLACASSRNYRTSV